ncbi:hypothetical protein ACFLSA_01035 [Bacteroidota bacterium]
MRFVYSILLISSCFSLSGQILSEHSQQFYLAEDYFNYFEYDAALPLYLQLNDAYPSNFNIKYKLGICYLYGDRNIDKSILYLNEAVNHISSDYIKGMFKEQNAPEEALLYLGIAYHVKNNFSEARNFYKQFRDLLEPDDIYNITFISEQLKKCDIAESLVSLPVTFEYERLSDNINSGQSNFYPVLSGDENTMVYTIYDGDKEEIYLAEKNNNQWKEGRNITVELEEENIYPTGLSFDGYRLYLYKEERQGSDLYVSNFRNGKWTKPEKLNKNINTRDFETHATESKDGSQLFFTSDKKEGFGGLDIYVTKKQENGDWGPATNLGPAINTRFNEETPCIVNNGKILYFSSEGHYNMGGYDIFYSNFTDDNQWTIPMNLGFPINTAFDDIFYYPSENNEYAMYAMPNEETNRKSEIFKVMIKSKENLSNIKFNGYISLSDGKKVENRVFLISVIDKKNNDTLSFETKSGEYSFEKKSGSYTIEIKCEGYETRIEYIEIPKDYLGNEYTLYSELIPELPGMNYLAARSIYFNQNDTYISKDEEYKLSILINALQFYPSLVVEISAPLFSGNEINLKRIDGIRDYILNSFIHSNRIVKSWEKVSENSDETDAEKRRVDIYLKNMDRNVSINRNVLNPEYFKSREKLPYTIFLARTGTEPKVTDEIDGLKVNEFEIHDGFYFTTGEFESKTEGENYLIKCVSQGFGNSKLIRYDEIGQVIKLFNPAMSAGKVIPTGYTIQLMALLVPVPLKYFIGLENIKVYNGNDGYYRYVYGLFNTYKEAKAETEKLYERGYKDTYIRKLSELQKN